MSDTDETRGGSSPCFEHLIIGGESVDPAAARDVARFRKAERARLLEARQMPLDQRNSATDALIQGLEEIILPGQGQKIAVYWPIRGEPDLRRWMASAHDAGAQVLLPVVVEKAQPLEFRIWSPGCRMTRGFWNILVPEEGTPVIPDTVISPLVGGDRGLYRLGNGGGYYDRTLAALQPRPRTIGVGFAGTLIDSIFPMPWDIPMDEILLSDGTHLTKDTARR
ncbi:5-formyltetrahydrofolate cyclo-ligase [Poseidonocella pacifica]|uniref:5-formyltetrahydrofolate cyclo-ligase n=1 Tax=Poseidonocella pacifica TaxID=871651 RepID=A0A1I0UYB3_9RHOB|nr:5-formyltetrahydrofolate cyclo-ligase [Poseidonocella pacifica]SFA68992.1 5-formyltetrahydrofolate cyclo-ligase [Poseidonocella pacifica]